MKNRHRITKKNKNQKTTVIPSGLDCIATACVLLSLPELRKIEICGVGKVMEVPCSFS